MCGTGGRAFYSNQFISVWGINRANASLDVWRIRLVCVVAFDKHAGTYDDLFGRSRICTQREVVWQVLAETFHAGDAILTLNCKTGEDARFLSLLDISVAACDTRERMVTRPGALFDGALSNFSGLHSVADLNRTACYLASTIRLGAPLIVCLSTRFCLSEALWFLVRGKVRKAFRRSSAIAIVKAGDSVVKMHYPALKKVRQSFSPSFAMRSCKGIGVVIPPSFLDPLSRKYPRMLNLLRRIDRSIANLPLFRSMGDHMLIHFERVQGCQNGSSV
jgi:hypothetical protein